MITYPCLRIAYMAAEGHVVTKEKARVREKYRKYKYL